MSADRVLSSCADSTAAAWIAPRLMSFGSGVGALVPPVFESYARVLHPARAQDGSPVRWADVAAWSGRTVHSLAQWVPMAFPRESPSLAATPLASRRDQNAEAAHVARVEHAHDAGASAGV